MSLLMVIGIGFVITNWQGLSGSCTYSPVESIVVLTKVVQTSLECRHTELLEYFVGLSPDYYYIRVKKSP